MQGRREPAYTSTWATEDAAARPSSVIPAAQPLFRQALLGLRDGLCLLGFLSRFGFLDL